MSHVKQFLPFGFIGLLILLSGCAAPGGSQTGETTVRSGVIEQIENVKIASNHQRGVGAVVGGLSGLAIGSLIGGGTGRDLAMVAGTIGGAVAGNELEKKNSAPTPGQKIVVRMTNGVLVSITQPAYPGLAPGQLVYIEGSGENSVVRPQ